MEGEDRQKAYKNLTVISDEKGFLTLDDIIEASDRFNLPISDVDWLSNSLTTRGIIIYDSAPAKVNTVENDDDDYSDYAQIDYEEAFRRVIELDPSLSTLINEIKSIRPPQYKEFRQLIYQAKEGNEHAKTRIIEMHLRIAVRVALQRAEAFDTEIADCIGDAFEGLITAIDKYDPDTSGPFSSYASLWIFQRISRMQSTQRQHVYYPVHKKENFFSSYPALKNKGCPNCDHIWNCTKVRQIIENIIELQDNHVDDVISMTQPFESFDAIYESLFLENNNVFEKHIYKRFIEAITSDEDIQDDLIEEEMKVVIRDSLNSLKEKEKQVLCYRFGIEDGEARTLEEVGEIFGVTRERIRQIESKALKKMASSPISKKLEGYIFG